MSAELTRSTELRQLIARLEGSGLADRRADVRLLLEQSRARLGAPAERPRPSAAKARRKLAVLAGALLDMGFVSVAVFACAGVLFGSAGVWGPLALLACAGWGLLRLRLLRLALAEAPLVVAYLAGWSWDWVAEAFSEAATARLQRRLDAWAVMREWRRHRASLPGRADAEALRAFIGQAHGQAALAALDARMEPRLAALRWVALMQAFAATVHAPVAAEIEAPILPEPAVTQAEPPEHAAHHAQLREMIRRKRLEVTTAYGWKLKTPAEIAQRELHVDGLKHDIAQLEKELAAMG